MSQLSLNRVLYALLCDQRGSISIEFMIVTPLLLFLTTGGIAFWDAFHSNSQTAKIAYAVSDIMSRHDFVDNTDMTYLYSVQDKMMPADLDQRSLRISSICFEDDQHRVLWSYSAGSSGPVTPDPLVDDQIPVGILPAMSPQDSVILTEVKARWQPYFLNVGLGTKKWSSVLVSRPRFVKIIPHTGLNPAKICPSAS